MKRWLVPLGILFSAILGLSQESKRLPDLDRQKHQIRVVTYNILGGRNTDGSRDLTRVAAVLKAMNPDLVALQEVDVKTRRIKGLDVPKELGALTELQPFFAEAMPFDGGSYGDAALTRLPVDSQQGHALPARPKSEPRAALELICRLGEAPDAPKIRFIATHLDHLRAGDDRVMQVKKLLEFFPEPSAAPPSVLAGDFNAELSDSGLALLQPKWVSIWPKGQAVLTFPSDQPRIAIDHVFLGRDASWKVLRVVAGVDIFPGDPAWKELLAKASDHVPVVVELELP